MKILLRKSLRTILIIVAASVVMMEIVLRLSTLLPTDSQFYVIDSDIGYRMRPHIVIDDNSRTNSFGFNDVEHTKTPRDGGVRIAIIGDSFVFGAVPREKNFTFVFQRLANAAGVDVEVLNMGIMGAGPQNYVAMLKNDAVLMNVDIVCVVFFVGNDIVQSHPDFERIIWLGTTRQVLRQPYLVGLSKEYYYVYRLMRSTRRLIRERIGKPSTGSFTKTTFLEIGYQRSGIHKKNKSSYIRQSYNGAIDLLKIISKEAEQAKKQLFVVLAPDELQVNRDLQRSLAQEYNMNLNDYDFAEPQRIITSKLRASGISVIDLLPSFQKEQQEEALYIKQDTHWNNYGNQLAAELIWSSLNEAIVVRATQLKAF